VSTAWVIWWKNKRQPVEDDRSDPARPPRLQVSERNIAEGNVPCEVQGERNWGNGLGLRKCNAELKEILQSHTEGQRRMKNSIHGTNQRGAKGSAKRGAGP